LPLGSPDGFQMISNAAPRTPDDIDPGKSQCLMVVDHAEESRAALAAYFSARGFSIVTAADGIQALSLAVSCHVDVVIMSATLPLLEGYEAAAILRRIDPRVQIILTMEPDVDVTPGESRHVESFRCFPKPFEPGDIARAIDEASTGARRPGEDPR
jgi:two-component system, OmpR family, response regulator